MGTRLSDVWGFKKDDSGRWSWNRQSLDRELMEQGRTSFAKFEECLADAQRCGYTGSFSLSDAPQRDVSSKLVRRLGR